MKKIIQCEHRYSKEYCTTYENDDFIRFRDYSLTQMRDHNYTYIKNKFCLKKLIEDEIKVCIKDKLDFAKVVVDIDDSDFELPEISYNYRLDKIAYYTFNISKISNIKSDKNAIIKKVSNNKMVEDMLFCDLQFDTSISHRDFHIKKYKRKGEVYILDNALNAYVCYEDDNAVGMCDLFMVDKVAKIENFVVIPSYQRKGYGTHILKKMIDIALENNAELIYLTTDEDDTAKEMYEKLYFDKVGKRLELVFDLSKLSFS